jgi:hypothetical protein
MSDLPLGSAGPPIAIGLLDMSAEPDSRAGRGSVSVGRLPTERFHASADSLPDCDAVRIPPSLHDQPRVDARVHEALEGVVRQQHLIPQRNGTAVGRASRAEHGGG